MGSVLKSKNTGILLALSLALCSCASTFTPHDANRTIASTQPSIDSATFTHELESRMYRIEEFAALRKWGAKNGVRVFGAGGTAAGLAVYIKQNLENEALKREGKPAKYFEGRFSYNYFDIYRSTQDADIVIDGTEEDARKLEAFLQQNFNYLEGSKSVWEVRLLNQSRGEGAGEKDPLLGFDFQNQNSDSFSTGMIELTDPPRGESKVRDLFDWKNQRDPKFLQDILDGKITFYVNPKHFQTKRAAAGMNPEILSAIRVLTKAFQYEGEISAADEKELRRIIRDWDPIRGVDSYLANQISKNGQKLFWHSPDVERASNTLDDLGLKTKLIEFGNAHHRPDLSTWLSRAPLPTRPLGKVGKTAKELGITVVAHETNSFIAYENMSRSLKGKPNVFISRENTVGESASFGDGFYTAIGKKGAAGTGLTIRFAVNPNARDGIDFHLHNGFIFLVQNAAALKVIDESLNISPVEYFRLLTAGDLSVDDKGILEKMKFKLRFSSQNLTAEERRELNKMAHAEYIKLRDAKKASNVSHSFFLSKLSLPITPFFAAWLGIPHSEAEHEFLVKSAELFRPKDITVIPALASLPEFSQWVADDFATDSYYAIHERLRLPHMVSHPSYETWVNQALKINTYNVAAGALHSPDAIRHEAFPRFFEKIYKKDPESAIYLLNQTGVEGHPFYDQWLKRLIKKNPEKVTQILLTTERINALKSDPRFESWINLLISTGSRENTYNFLYGSFRFLENDPRYSKWMENFFKKSGEKASVDQMLKNAWFTMKDSPHFEKWISTAIDHYPDLVLEHILRENQYANHPAYDAWMKKIIPKMPNKIGNDVISSKVRTLGQNSHYVEWMFAVIQLDPTFEFDFQFYFPVLDEKNQNKLKMICGQSKVTVECLREGLKKSKKCKDLLH